MRIGLGCVNLGSASHGRSTRDDVRLVHRAIELGVTVFDTADVYGSGSSERVLGDALRSRRSEVTIATKAGYVFRARPPAEQSARKLAKQLIGAVRSTTSTSTPATSTPATMAGGTTGGSYRQQDFSPDHLRAALDASLRRLRTDHVDVWQLHGPPHLIPGLVGELQDVVTSGKVRRFGVGAETLDAAVAWVGDVDVVQLPFGILDPEAAADVLPLVTEGRPEIWARGVLGGGLLAAAAAGGRQDDPKRPLIDRLDSLAQRHGLDIYALAIGYVRSFAEVSTMLLGTSSDAHLDHNLRLMAAPPLDADVLEELNLLVHDSRGEHQ